ncbi:MAG TPA: type II 3-dehydroquinate dehydratase [Dermatophilaceae bacterium]
MEVVVDVLLMNGPNLNSLGTRRPEVYGSTTLSDVEASFRSQAAGYGLTAECFQSNHEGAIIDRIFEAKAQGCRYFVINAGAYTHTSIAIPDAFEAVEIPFVEIHISNVHAREEFRQHSYLSAVAAGVIVGCGVKGYSLALDLVAHRLGLARSGEVRDA